MNGLQMKYFVLKPKGNDVYAAASRKAMRAYANHIEQENPELSKGLREWAKTESDSYFDSNVNLKKYLKLQDDVKRLTAELAEANEKLRVRDMALEGCLEELKKTQAELASRDKAPQELVEHIEYALAHIDFQPGCATHQLKIALLRAKEVAG